MGIKHLLDRPCSVCEFHTEKGCSKWSCVFEQEPKTEWIPVSERLPEEDGRYLCTYENEFGGCVDFGKFYKGDWFVGRVTAWMPLPKPYKESEDKE